jgi:hypothetical protein
MFATPASYIISRRRKIIQLNIATLKVLVVLFFLYEVLNILQGI